MEHLEKILRRMARPVQGKRYALTIEIVNLGEGPTPYMARVTTVESWSFDGEDHFAREILSASGQSFATITEAAAEAERVIHTQGMRSRKYFPKPRT